MNKKKTGDQVEFENLGKLVNEAKDRMKVQEEVVKSLKIAKKSKKEIKAATKILKKLEKEVTEITRKWRKADPNKLNINRNEFEQFLIRRFFFIPSNDIYGATSGFFDYGPPACAIQANILNEWRNHFVIEENMLEVDCSIITPSKVFEVSGHVKRFFDYMVKDEVSKECFRVDKVIEDFANDKMGDVKTTKDEIERLKKILQTLDDNNGEQFDVIVSQWNILSPKGNKLSKSFPFNLMFKTSIGPMGNQVGYLRPETAQGIFVNFKRLYDYNGNKLPFAGAQIGKSFRNEISPKSSILRVREFLQAEIEHFMDPNDTKSHPKFKYVKDLKIKLLSRDNQVCGKSEETMTLEEALKKDILKNVTLCYYIARCYLFMKKIGMIEEGIRFRQHLSTELAHYSKDCWDLELLTSYGWYEIVGLADRSCFDVENHARESKCDLYARRMLKKPIVKDVVKIEVVKKVFFKTYRKDSQRLVKYFENVEDDKIVEMQKEMEKNGKVEVVLENDKFDIPKTHIQFVKEQIKISSEKFIPAVIEPSFGIGRTLYCLLEHNYYVRPDPEGKSKIPRNVLSLVPKIAPYKCAILTTGAKGFDEAVVKVRKEISEYQISHKIDGGGRSVGRKYARVDDVGIPFAVTIDGDTVGDGDNKDTVTIRERDSCTQVRIPIKDLGEVMFKLTIGKLSWVDVQKMYKEQKQTATEKVGKGKKK